MFIHLLARFPGAPGPVTSRNVRINGLSFSKDACKTTSTVSDRTQRQAKLASSWLRGVSSDLGTLLSPARQCFTRAKHCVNECKFQCIIARHVLIVPVSLPGKLRQRYRAGYTWPLKERVAAAPRAYFYGPYLPDNSESLLCNWEQLARCLDSLCPGDAQGLRGRACP